MRKSKKEIKRIRRWKIIDFMQNAFILPEISTK
jgi:hypothetical protein